MRESHRSRAHRAEPEPAGRPSPVHEVTPPRIPQLERVECTVAERPVSNHRL